MRTLLLPLLAIGACFVPTLLSAQKINTTITGKITDPQQHPVSAATVALTKGDQTVKLAISENDGSYRVTGLFDPGAYTLTVTIVGMQKAERTVSVDPAKKEILLPVIVLEPQSRALKEVAVAAKKNYIEQKIDRTVVNADVLISNAGTSALEVLEKAPGVMVDANGAISLKGAKGVAIYIDDKPSYLSGIDLQNYLRSLPASLISQLEIMSNPPARYDAAGNGGIINIKTIKRTTRGFNMGINLGTRVARYTLFNESMDLNYRINKVNLFANLAYGTRNSYNDINIFRRYKNEDGSTKGILDQQSFLHRMGYGFKAVAGADYYVSSNTTIGVRFDGLLRLPKEDKTSNGTIFGQHGAPDSAIISGNQESGRFRNGGINLNFRHEFRKDGPTLDANADYLNYDVRGNQHFGNRVYVKDQFYAADSLTGVTPTTINIFTANINYSHPLKGNWNLATGAKYSATNTSNAASYFNIVGAQSYPDFDKTNHFLYKESIKAAYINANKEFGRLAVQVGLRLENTEVHGHQLGNEQKRDSSFARNYTNLFPTLFLLYKLDSLEHHQMKFNFGRRIDRPYYQDMNPFISPFDKYTYYVGNPYLQPSFSSRFELSYIFRNWLTISAGYTKAKDEVNETIEITDNKYYSKPGNIGETTLLNLGIDASGSPYSWLSLQASGQLNFVHAVSDFYTGRLDTRSSYVHVQGLAQFKLKKDWQLQLDGYYQSKLTSAQFVIAGRGRVNLGVAKKLSQAATIKLSVNDVFFTNISKGAINNLHLADASFRTLSDSRAVQLALSIRLGKKIEGQKSERTTSADSEQNRVKY